MLISLTVGKVDAGVAVLLTEDKRLIEFPSILLPSSISSGSIVDITVSRNTTSERAEQEGFETLQSSIFDKYGSSSPSAPVLRCRNATQTSVVLEWDPIELATADLRSLSLFRNGAKAGSIPRPLEITSTKISGLAIDMEYNFQLMLRTSAGTYQSSKLEVRTQKMTDLSGITVTPGVLPAQLRQSLARAVERVGGKLVETVRIDTTHFVCMEGRGKEWERAVEMNIPVVRPEWLEGCEREGRIVGVRAYYLNADPRLRQVGQGVGGGGGAQIPLRSRNESQASTRPPSGIMVDQRRSSVAGASNSGSERVVSPQTNVVPPSPPAKDTQHQQGRTNQSSGDVASPSSESVATSRGNETEEDGGYKEESKERVKTPVSRSLVSSPSDTTQKEHHLPFGGGSGGDAVASSEGLDPRDRQVSESGSLEDVAL